jgi:hypothetical protein
MQESRLHRLIDFAAQVRILSIILLGILLNTLPLHLAAQGLVINEFSSSNASLISDEDGEFSDWIELYNSSNAPIQLANFGLSDDPETPFKWTFPSRIIPSQAFLLVFASGKNRKTGDQLHTNFKIGASGEPLQLVNALGTILDAVPAIELSTDVSYGRRPDGGSQWLYFINQATPGNPNSANGSGQLLQPPSFSQAGGFYTTPVTLTLSTATDGAVIRYTLDGSEPTESSPMYTAPLPIAGRAGAPNVLSVIPTNQVTAGPSTFIPPQGNVFKARVVRARTFLPGSSASPTTTHTYFIDPQINQRYPLPVVSIATPREGFFGEKTGIYVPGDQFNGDHDRSGNYYQRGDAWERPAHVEFFDTDRSKGFSQQLGIRIHGSASRVDPQKSLRLYADDKYGKSSIQYPLFPDKPVSEFRRVLLRNAGNDRSFSFIRDVFIQSLVKDLNVDVQASRPVVVFLNGEYWGIHHLQERLDKHYVAANHSVHPDSLDYLEMDREVVDGSADHYQQMLDFINANDIRVGANYDTLAKRMDVDEFINYQIAEIYAANIDWPGNNLSYWRPQKPNGKWRWIFYDADFGFGLNENSDFDRNTLAYALEPNGPTFPSPAAANTPYGTLLFRTLIENQNFRNRFINRFADLLNTHFKPERVVQRLEEIKASLTPVMPEHIARWSAPASMNSWNSQLQVLRNFAQRRPKAQRNHLSTYFNLGDTISVTLQVSDPAKGKVQINSLVIDEQTTGLSNAPYPWQGKYFQNVPLQLTALPKPGYKFIGWDIVAQSGATLPQDASIQALLQQEATITAKFEVDSPPTLVMPSPYNLSQGLYSFLEWASSQPAAAYPSHMIFQRTDVMNPSWNSVEKMVYSQAYNLSSNSRIRGLGTDGFSFLNAGADGNLGSAVLALNTTGRTNVRVNWTGGTVSPNNRVYAIRLQYRIGNGAWTNIPGAQEYVRNSVAGHSQKFSLNLSASTSNAVDNQPLLYLRWKYYYVSGDSGSGAELRVADIAVSSTAPLSTPTRLAVIAVNNNRPPSRNMPLSLSIESRDEMGNPQPVSANTVVNVTLVTGNGLLTGNVSGTLLNGQSTLTISGLRYDRAETGVSLLVSRSSGNALQSGNSAAFDVLETASTLAFVGLYDYGAAGSPFRPFSVVARRPDNSLDANYSGNVTVSVASGNGTISGTLTRPLQGGVADFSDLIFSQGNLYTLSASSTNLTGTTSGAIKVAGFTEVLVPRFVQGKNGVNNNRVPFVFRATLHHLNANARYRYYNQMVLPTDALKVDGAGNVIFVNASEYYLAATVSVNQPGQYNEFTTDNTGTFTGWFVTEPSGNNRFTPGNQLQLRLILNDGGGGSDPFFRLTGSSSITVINPGNLANEASGLVGNSCAISGSIISLYDQAEGTGRPVAATVVENDGVDNGAAQGYAPFYTDQVNGQAGAWGTVIPNNLPNGIRRVEQRSLSDGSILSFSTSANGLWGTTQTVNPTGSVLAIARASAPMMSAPVVTQEGTELVSSSISDNQWYQESQPIAGATARRFTPTQSGSYRVLVNGNNCPDNFSQPFNYVLTDPPNSNVWKDLLLYPNPSNGLLRITWTLPAQAPVEFRLVNIVGKEIIGWQTVQLSSDTEADLNLFAPSNGIYLLQVKSGQSIETRKVWLMR